MNNERTDEGAPAAAGRARIAYVLKRYPRFSETFIVNEILAHEAAGAEIHIFALRPPSDPHFQPAIGRVRAAVTYLAADHLRGDILWSQIQKVAGGLPRVWNHLSAADKASGIEVYQAACLAEEVHRRRIDHIHAHFATAATSVARLGSLFTGVPYSFTAHAKDIFHESVDAAELAQKIDGAASIVTVSDFNVQFLAAQFDCAHKLRRIYNGLDLEQFQFDRPAERPPKIVAVGRLVEKKGFDSLLDACSLLRESGVEFHCEIIGGGERERALRRHIDELDLAALVQLSGPRPLTYVQEAIRQAAALAAPCVTASTGDRDGLPMVLLESMASGTPVVATSVTGIPEVVHDEETGLLVPEGRPTDLARALERLLLDSNLCASLAFAARNLIERQFDLRQNAAELRDLFSACGRQSAPALALAEVG